MTCPFCDIIAGRADAPGLVRNPHGFPVVTFQPLNPVTPGHVLVVPEQHIAHAGADPGIAGLVFRAAAATANWNGYKSFNLITSAGVEATQSVFHLHIHVVPRTPGDGLRLPWSPD